VIEPRSRTVDAELLMESLFKLTELENRIPLNMNVLVKGRIPRCSTGRMPDGMARPRRDVLVRRSKHRLAAIEHRLEVLGGFLIAYLNLDKVIKIIRKEDEPKPVLMKTFKISDVQADAILNMRLRNLRKLEEMEIRTEEKALREERTKIKSLIGSTDQQWRPSPVRSRKFAIPSAPRPRSASGAPPSAKRPSTTSRDRRGHGGARADHRGGVGQGLDPRLAGPCHRFLKRRIQVRRRAEIRLPTETTAKF